MLRMHTLQCSSFLRPLNRLPLSLSQNLLLQYNVTSLSFRCRTERDRRRVCRCIAQAGTDTNFSTSGNALRDSNARLGSDRDGTMGPQTSVSSGVRSNVNSSTMRPPVAQPVMPAVIKSYRVSLWDAMKFNGPAPEIINGRLAMIGILAAAANEINYSETVLQQVQHVQVRILILTAVVVYSSLTPILKGAKSEAFGIFTNVCYIGIFTPRAEITNGRAAMLGFACLLFLENTSHVPFF